MTRTELYREKRKGISKSEYRILEMLNEVSEKLDYVIDRIDKTSESLYELAKQPTDLFDDKYNKLIEAVETIKEFINSCEGSTTALITKSGEMLCTDWGYFEDGLDEIEKYARGTE